MPAAVKHIYTIVFLQNEQVLSATLWKGTFSLAKDYAREIWEQHWQRHGATRAEIRDDIDRVVFRWPKPV
jgi:hypothetical protein